MNDERLITCASLCVAGKAVDCGTDHGYLATYLIEKKICHSCVACDINEMPLEQARKTVDKFNMAEKITIVLSDGLDNVSPEGVTNVIMAGMGGELIAQLLGRCDWITDKARPVNLVLQPMTKADFLRKWLYDNGFTIKAEKACEDGRFVYSCIQAEYTNEISYACDDRYVYGGMVKLDSEIGRKYLENVARKLTQAGNGKLKSKVTFDEGNRLLSVAENLLR